MPALVLTALALALVMIDATFAVAGFRDLLSGAPLVGTVIGAALVAVKVTVAARLKAHWPTVSLLRRMWGVALAAGIMLLTSASTYTYLSAAQAGLSANRDGTAQQVVGIEDRIALHQRALDAARQEEESLTRVYDGYLAAGKVSRADAARKDDADQFAEIRRRIEREQAAIEQGQADRAAAQQQLAGETAKLGPAATIARLIGDERMAANAFIAWMMVMFEAALIYMSGEALQAIQQRRDGARAIPEPLPAAPLPAVEVTAQPAALVAAKPELAVQEDAGAVESELVEPPPVKNRGGRPPGSKDKAPRKRKGEVELAAAKAAA